MEHTYDAAAGALPLHLVRGRPVTAPRPSSRCRCLKGWQTPNRIAPSAAIATILSQNLADIGLAGEEVFGRPRVGKALTQEARYIPTLLWALTDALAEHPS